MNTNKNKTTLLRVATAGAVAMALMGCGEPPAPIGEYSQWVGNEQETKAQASATASGPVRWQTPEGWSDRGPSSMRVTTFVVGNHQPALECTISIFPGDTGGVRANLGRWLGQLGLPADDATLDGAVAGLLPVKTAGGWDASLVDFRALARENDVAQALLGAIVPLEGQTLFVKFTAPPAVLDTEIDSVRGLIESLAPGGQP